MKIFIKKYFFIIAIAIGWIFSGCSAGNKVIPDLFDITKIDSTNEILSFFNVYGLGDTSFNMEINSLDSIAADFKNTVKDDSIKIIGIQTNGSFNRYYWWKYCNGWCCIDKNTKQKLCLYYEQRLCANF